MEYSAVYLTIEGAIQRHPDTLEPKVHFIGEFDSMDDAIKQACIDLNCINRRNGVLLNDHCGFVVVDSHELQTV